MHTPSDDAIRERAYILWIEAGSPEGNDLYFWHAAEQELAKTESGADAVGEGDSDSGQSAPAQSETPEQPSPY